ncbi:response regulator transcription factor [Terribacillus saccharophilus]|uniref:response regulator transcription factor n=1 Tax=Terribacillus saccharophilus TaxID=361277 RepID=UPI002DCD8301|nr:response regulator transcription factor [Terribacillus saccharophilus]
MRNILVVEDEPYMLQLIEIHLREEYILTQAKDGAEALEFINNNEFDLIVLDIMLPYVNGWSICDEIRKKYDTPILMLTARQELSDKVKGFEKGADDYLIKPFEFEELKVRIKALLRRSYKLDKSKINRLSYLAGQFVLDKIEKKVLIQNQNIELTSKEYKLVELLSSSPSRVFTREVLLDQIWDPYEATELRTVDSHIKNLRNKIKTINTNYKFIKTVWGIGYTFEIEEDS